MLIEEIKYKGPKYPVLGLTEGAYTHAQLLTEQQILENFLDSAKQYLGSKFNQTIQHVSATITDFKQAGLLLKEIFNNPEYFERVDFQVGRHMNQQLKQFRQNLQEVPVLKQVWSWLSPILIKARNMANWLGLLVRLILHGIFKFMNQKVADIAKGLFIDEIKNEGYKFVSKLIQTGGDFTMQWFFNIMSQFELLQDFFLEELSAVRRKLNGIQVSKAPEQDQQAVA